MTVPKTPADVWLQQVLDEEIQPLFRTMHAPGKRDNSPTPRLMLLDRDSSPLFLGCLVFVLVVFTFLLH